jgi:penicillin-binding protein 1C
VVFDAGLEAPRDEWLLTKTPGHGSIHSGPLRVRAGEQLAQQRPSGISSPRDGSIFALDPDMPAPVQRIQFSGEAGQWWLDGRLIGSGTRIAWSPWPGRHVLVLKSAAGQALDTSRFEVRGATVKR